jgi:hypothetical protein
MLQGFAVLVGGLRQFFHTPPTKTANPCNMIKKPFQLFFAN